MNRRQVRQYVACGLLLCAAVHRLASAQKLEKYGEIEQKAQQAQGGKRAELLSDLAFLDFQRARGSYDAGQALEGARQLEVAHDHGRQAMALLNEIGRTGKTHGMKHVEIQFRKLAFGLRELARSISLDDRPPVQEAHKYFSEARDEILRMMFGGTI